MLKSKSSTPLNPLMIKDLRGVVFLLFSFLKCVAMCSTAKQPKPTKRNVYFNVLQSTIDVNGNNVDTSIKKVGCPQ